MAKAAKRAKAKQTRSAAAHKQPLTKLPRAWKGKRVRIHESPAVDQLFGIVAALTAELSVTHERMATLEAVLRRRGHLGADDIESYEMDDAEALARTTAREVLIERVFQVLETWRDNR